MIGSFLRRWDQFGHQARLIIDKNEKSSEQTSKLGVLVDIVKSVGEITLIVVAADIGELVHPANSAKTK